MSFDPTHQDIAELMMAVLPSLNRLVSTRLRQEIEDETSLSQMRVLRELSAQPITLSELAERRFITRQAASLQVQGLVEKGWVRRLPHPTDRRQALLEVTDEGRAHWLEARHSVVEYLATLFDRLTPDELAALEAALPALARVVLRPREEPEVALSAGPP